MPDRMMEQLLAERGAKPAAERYAKGMFGSYVRRADDALKLAKLLRAQREAKQRDAGTKGLLRATEQVCKAVRVASNQSATRSRDVRALLFGDDLVDPLSDTRWRARIEPIVRLTEREVWTEAQLEAWVSALDAIVADLGKVEPPPKPPMRSSRFGAR